MKLENRILALLMAGTMLVSNLPLGSFAQEPGKNSAQTEINQEENAQTNNSGDTGNEDGTGVPQSASADVQLFGAAVPAAVDPDTLYTQAYNATVKARETKLQSDVDAARAAIKAMLGIVSDELCSTLSAELDKVQQYLYVEAAAPVIALINKLPETITADDKDMVLEARAAFDALSAAEKTCVTNLDALQTKEAALADILYQAAYNATIKARDEVTQENVNAARAAIAALEGTGGAWAMEEFSHIVDVAQQTIYQENAKPVVDAIQALPEAVTAADRDAILAARAAYEALSPDEKTCVPNLDVLQTKEAALAGVLYQAAYDAAVKARDEVTQENVNAARAAIAALEGTGGAWAMEEFSHIVDVAQQTIYQENAKPVVDAIQALPEAVTAADRDAILAARAAYEALSPDEKTCVPNLDVLQTREAALAGILYQAAYDAATKAAQEPTQENVDAARAAIAALEGTGGAWAMGELSRIVDGAQQNIYKEDAQSVVDAIEALPETVTAADRDAILAVRAAYEALSPEVKTCVTNLDVLQSKEAALAGILYQAAYDAASKAAQEPTQENVNAARAAIAALEGTGGAWAMGELSRIVDGAQQKIYQKEAKPVIDAIQALPETVIAADRNAILAARAAYEALSAEAKTCVSNIEQLKAKETKLADILYAAAYNAVEKALKTPTQENVDAARTAIAALEGTGAAFAMGEFSKQLDAVQNAIYQGAVDAVASAIDAIPADDTNAAFEQLLAAANEKYNALTQEQKNMLAPEKLEKLNQANFLKTLNDTFRSGKAYQATKKINKYNVLFSQETKVREARDELLACREAYSSKLSQQQMKTIDGELERLNQALTALFHASAVIWRVDNLPEELTAGDADTMLNIEHARIARFLLNWHTIDLVGAVRLQKLEKLLDSYEHYKVIPVKEQTEKPDLIFLATGSDKNVKGLRINNIKAEMGKDFVVSTGKDEDGKAVTRILLKAAYLQKLPDGCTVELAVEYSDGLAMGYYRDHAAFAREY